MNPRSMAPISMFNATIYNSNMKPLFYYNNSVGPTVLMTGTKGPGSFGFERSIAVNGQNSNYTWTIKIGNYYEQGDIVNIVLPTGVRFTDFSRCFGTSFWLDGEIDCKLSQNRQEVTFAINLTGKRRLQEFIRGRSLLTTIPAGSLINFMITEITSPDSLKPVTGNIKYSIEDPNGFQIE